MGWSVGGVGVWVGGWMLGQVPAWWMVGWDGRWLGQLVVVCVCGQMYGWMGMGDAYGLHTACVFAAIWWVGGLVGCGWVDGWVGGCVVS